MKINCVVTIKVEDDDENDDQLREYLKVLTPNLRRQLERVLRHRNHFSRSIGFVNDNSEAYLDEVVEVEVLSAELS